MVWELTGDVFKNPFPKEISLDVLNTKGYVVSQKNFYNEKIYINKWIIPFSAEKNSIGNLYFTSNDFQQNNLVYISLRETSSHLSSIGIDASNITVACMYFSVRHCIEHTWINHNDQFLYPDDDFRTDEELNLDALIYTLFHGKNNIRSQHGVNRWIPFTEQEVDAKEKFASNFMSSFLKGKTLSVEALTLMDAGRELWRYYHGNIKGCKTASVNASFYDIREFFQGRKESGTMNAKSADETYNDLLKSLRDALKALAKKIEPKVYEYGFLRE